MAQAGPVDEKSLRKLLSKDDPDPLVELRLRFIERSQLLTHYLLPMSQGHKKSSVIKPDGRVYPTMLPTQASGRWSIKEPPLVTFPSDCINPDCPQEAHLVSPHCWSARDIVQPDPGTTWLKWDFDAIEARIVACESNDRDDIEAFLRGYDLHTMTACQMFSMDRPPTLTNALHTDEASKSWREKYTWRGKEDRRRIGAKVARYALFYGVDEKPILQSKDAARVGVPPSELLEMGRLFLASKPALTAWKRKTWEQVWREHRAVTFLGRPRRFLGDYYEVVKEGLNHKIQGAVADVMNRVIIDALDKWPFAWLVVQSHDGATLCVPDDKCDNVWPKIRCVVEREWTINGHKMPLTAEWKLQQGGKA